MRAWGLRIILGLAAIATATGAMAQKPPLRLIVPFPPGGPVDFVGRVIADGLRARSNTAVIVDNRAGANGALGIAALKQAAPDGTTLLVVSSGMITFSPHFEKNLPYDAARDFAPVANAAYTDVAFVVANNMPANDLREFVALARSRAKPLAMGSAGQGNITHAYLELFKDAAGCPARRMNRSLPRCSRTSGVRRWSYAAQRISGFRRSSAGSSRKRSRVLGTWKCRTAAISQCATTPPVRRG